MDRVTAQLTYAATLAATASAMTYGNTDTGATMASALTCSNATYHVVPGGYPNGPPQTGLMKGTINSFTDGAPVFLYIFFATTFGLSFIYAIMRFMSISALKGRVRASNPSRHEEGQVAMVAMQDNMFGTICNFLVSNVYTVMAMWYLTILLDTYWNCQLKGPDNLCFYGSRPIFGHKFTDAQIFFSWWCVALSWNLVMFFKGKYIRNFFRSECLFTEATHISVLAKNKKQVMVSVNWIVKLSRKIAKNVFGEDEYSYYRVTVPVVDNQGRRSVDVLCKRYTFNSQSNVFEPAAHKLPSQYSKLRSENGLTQNEAATRLSIVGENSIPYKVSSWSSLIFEELNSYLYLYQFTIYSLWLWFSALTWGSPQVVVVLTAAAISVYLTRYNQSIIQKITEYSANCEVFRNGSWVIIDAAQLVPGDKVKLSGEERRDWILPCDLIMTKGQCITDESGLTGESMPVRKIELPQTEGNYEVEKDNKHTLFAGTTLLQSGSSENDEVYAVVSETGIRTTKGELVSHILFPSDMIFQYDEELRIVFMMLMIYAFGLFGVSVWLQIKIAPLKWVSIFAFALFTISQILPPLLPIALVVGHTMSAKRLKDRKVLCVNPKRIAISGKIHAFMFDKTGTLTKQGLDFLGVRETTTSGFKSGVSDANASGALMSQALATCHAVTTMASRSTKSAIGYGDTEKALRGGGRELVGNQVEVKMFEACGYELIETPGKDPQVKKGSTALTIVKRFEFDHHSMTMSVVVKDSSGLYHVFCKGAPEKVGDLCQSTPADFNPTHQKHAMEGCYVLGVSHRELGKITDSEVQMMPRSEVEVAGKLNLLGLLLFRNELKPDTAAAIAQLHAGDVRTVMVTGDNAQCGLYIAREANFLEPSSTIYLGDVPKGGNGQVGFSKMDGLGYKSSISPQQALELCRNSSKSALVELAITGNALKILQNQPIMSDLLLHTRIFARVKPDQKVKVVEMHMEEGLITGMCGDGGNDCGALRAAHAGIALSDAEASVVSPFTSGTKSVMSCVHLLQEGRCALATSFAAYKFYITYGLNWSVVKTINFVYGVRMPITGYLTVDSISSWLVAWAITLALPLPSLLPYRPTTSLFAPGIMLSVLTPWVMWMCMMGGALVYQQNHKDHVNFPAHLTKGVGYWQLGDDWEATVFTTFMVFPLIWSGIVFSLGSKFRRSVFLNPFIWVVWTCIFLLYSCFLLIDVNDATAIFHVASNAFNGRNTESPTWMRYQFPQGCFDHVTGYPTLALNRTRMAGWEPDNCAMIQGKTSAASCGPACAAQDPPYGDPSPGMSYEMRVNLFIMILCGMAAMLVFENVLNFVFVKPDPPLQEVQKRKKAEEAKYGKE